VKLENGEELWEITGILFSPAQEKVSWFVVKKHFIVYDFFYSTDIIGIYPQYIIINPSDTSLLKQEHLYELSGKWVKNEFWESIGLVENVEFDDFYSLKSIIVDCFLFIGTVEVLSPILIRIKKDIRKIPKTSILSYWPKHIVIREVLHIKQPQMLSPLELFPLW